MFKISDNAIPTLAGDIKNVVDATDVTLTLQAQMLTSSIEAIRTSNLPLAVSQRMISDIADGLNDMIGARASIRKAVATMTSVGRQSQHKEMLDGCPGGVPSGAMPEVFETIA